MTSLFSLPDWLPWWVPMAVLVPTLLYLVVFLLMPFSVFGLKGRLEAIEARLDEVQGEIRTLVLRMPENRGRSLDWTDPAPPIPPARAETARGARPPVSPAPTQAPRRPAFEPDDLPVRPAPPPRPPRFAETPYPETRYDQPRDPVEPRARDEAPLNEPGEETSPPRRTGFIRQIRSARSEPRLDWPP